MFALDDRPKAAPPPDVGGHPADPAFDAEALAREFAWLGAAIDARLKAFFAAEEAGQPPAPPDSGTARPTGAWSLGTARSTGPAGAGARARRTSSRRCSIRSSCATARSTGRSPSSAASAASHGGLPAHGRDRAVPPGGRRSRTRPRRSACFDPEHPLRARACWPRDAAGRRAGDVRRAGRGAGPGGAARPPGGRQARLQPPTSPRAGSTTPLTWDDLVLRPRSLDAEWTRSAAGSPRAGAASWTTGGCGERSQPGYRACSTGRRARARR